MSDFLLEPPVDPAAPGTAAVPAAKLTMLGGVDWSGIAAEARGEIALVDVEPGEGERQEWAKRGDA